ncbi:hypothetical protein ADENT20671_0058 [Actinomyces denticolens]|nr:hypothetical protein ADENT20671_0058 [Actinomyces denticolens]
MAAGDASATAVGAISAMAGAAVAARRRALRGIMGFSESVVAGMRVGLASGAAMADHRAGREPISARMTPIAPCARARSTALWEEQMCPRIGLP